MHPAQVFTIFKSVLKSSSHTVMHDIGEGLEQGVEEAKHLHARPDRDTKEIDVKNKKQNSTDEVTETGEPKVHNNESVNNTSATDEGYSDIDGWYL